MRLVTFNADGAERIGALQGDEIVELSGLPAGVTDMKGFIEISSQAELVTAPLSTNAWSGQEVALRPPVPNPDKIICVGLNYRDHQEEAGQSERGWPTIFTRFADTQIAHRDPAIRPAESLCFDYEGELAVVIGCTAHHVVAEDAWRHVAGVAGYNDFSARDWQRHSTQWIPGKNFPRTGAFGPALVTTDELPGIEDLALTTRVNGEVRQQASLGELIFDIPFLISYISSFTALAPGDVIVTGTPGGVGAFMDPPTFLEIGDEVEVEITEVGVLCNTVAADGVG
jgi:2-keto-4-pentenoate hydratase/2-oxohepta-3-ene-1,7-dioic acid hydratase in catechol pathway